MAFLKMIFFFSATGFEIPHFHITTNRSWKLCGLLQPYFVELSLNELCSSSHKLFIMPATYIELSCSLLQVN